MPWGSAASTPRLTAATPHEAADDVASVALAASGAVALQEADNQPDDGAREQPTKAIHRCRRALTDAIGVDRLQETICRAKGRPDETTDRHLAADMAPLGGDGT